MPEDLKLNELLDRLITTDYKGRQDKKQCLTELLIRLKVGAISIDEVMQLINRGH